MKSSKILGMLSIALCLCSYSTKENPEETIPAERKTVKSLNVSDYGKWTYINFESEEQKQYDDFSEWIY